MISDVQLETMRDLFYVEKEIVLMELREIMEKTAAVEKLLREELKQSEPEPDAYKPCSGLNYPPKKRAKFQ